MLTFIKNSLHYIPDWVRRHKILSGILGFLALIVLGMYAIALWYIHGAKSQPLQMGVSFIPAYAQSLGVDPKENMDALLDMGVKHFRLVSYWNSIEYQQGSYDFNELDWQFQKAEAKGAKITLTVGLRQPRWPECHAPAWVDLENKQPDVRPNALVQPKELWQDQLNEFMTAVIERYKHSPALQDYQLENEYFLKGFGICTDFSRDRLISEYNLVKKLDPTRTVIVGRSNNALGWPVGQPQPDKFSISVYKRVWDAGVTHRYLEYPWPAWYYGFLAGWQKIMTGKDMAIGELQSEAWAPNNKAVKDISLDEQNKSLSPERFKDRIEYGKATGMRQIYLWGAEYWYYRMHVLNDPSLWNVAKQEFQADKS